MTDKRESDEPVRVLLTLHDSWYVPFRKHEKTVEIDREDWEGLEAYERRDIVEDLQRTWLEEVFDLSYEVLGADSFDDVSAGD